MTIPISLLSANSSNELIDGFSLGVVSDEVTIPVYELTKTVAHKTQTPAKIRNELRLKASLPPIVDQINDCISVRKIRKN